MPVTLYHGTKVTTAKLIEEACICSVTDMRMDSTRQVPHDTNKKEVSMKVPLPPSRSNRVAKGQIFSTHFPLC